MFPDDTSLLTPPGRSPLLQRVIHLAVFLLTWSGLVFEIGLTRIYSATIWYHYAFIAVSVALLGWGLGGVALHLARRRVDASLDKAAVLAALYGLTLPICLWLIVKFPFQMDRLPLYFLAPLFPFLLAGAALSMIFQLRREIAPTLYFADLAGASMGALGVTLLLEYLGGEATLLVAAVTPFLAAACLSRRLRGVASFAAVVVAVLAFSNGRTNLFRVTPGELKAMQRHMREVPGTHVTQTGWNCVLAHRRGRGLSRAESCAALHRFRCLDQRIPLGRQHRRAPRHARVVSRVSVQVHPERRDARHRPGRRI